MHGTGYRVYLYPDRVQGVRVGGGGVDRVQGTEFRVSGFGSEIERASGLRFRVWGVHLARQKFAEDFRVQSSALI